MRILHLTLFKKYFDKILIGEKTVEYRVRKPYWEKRLLCRAFDEVRFVNGYGAHRPFMVVVVKSVSINGEIIEIRLGDITSSGNLGLLDKGDQDE